MTWPDKLKLIRDYSDKARKSTDTTETFAAGMLIALQTPCLIDRIQELTDAVKSADCFVRALVADRSGTQIFDKARSRDQMVELLGKVLEKEAP